MSEESPRSNLFRSAVSYGTTKKISQGPGGQRDNHGIRVELRTGQAGEGASQDGANETRIRLRPPGEADSLDVDVVTAFRILPTLLLVLAGTLPAGAATGIYGAVKVRPSIRMQAFPFTLERVRLLEGPFRDAREQDRKYLLSLEPDRMLAVLLKTSGQTPKVDQAYHAGGTLVGHYLTAISKMYAGTGEEELRKRAHYIIDELERLQAANGGQYIGVRNSKEQVQEKLFDAEELEAAHGHVNGLDQFLYCWHKITAGLIDAHVHFGNEKALPIAARYADWYVERFAHMDDEKFQTHLKMENGGILEALVWLYALTGEQKYLNLARRFDHKRDMDPLARREDRLQGLHANTVIPKVTGAAVLYEFSGRERYATISEFFWQRMVKARAFITGGVDYQEFLMSPGTEAAYLDYDSNESCCVYNLQKLTRHLFSWQPRAEYMDYYERALYNHVLATQDPDGLGRYAYFSGLKPGDFKVYSTSYDSMWCCVKTGMENHARHGNSIYFHGEDTLWLNLFIPSVLDWKEKGITLRQETDFPESDRVTVRIEAQQAQEFSLKLRVPHWVADDVEVRINGEKQDVPTRPRSYLTLKRTWKDGDVIDYRVPMKVQLYRARDDRSVVSLLYGPIVLAGLWGGAFMPGDDTCEGSPHVCFLGEASQPVPVLLEGAGDPSSWVQPVKKSPLLFRTVNTHNRKEVFLAPIHRVHHQRYSVYWKLVDPALLQQPPEPEQARWLVPPYPASGSSLAMIAAAADHPVAGPVEYYFDEQTGHPGGDDSGWQADPVYVDRGLEPDTQYAYRVLTRSGANIRWDDYIQHYRVVDRFQIPMADPPRREGMPSEIRSALCPEAGSLTHLQSPGEKGMVIFEAEDFQHNEERPDAAWRVVNRPSGLSGGAGLQALPEEDRTLEEDLNAVSPRLDYRIHFTTKGTHYLWIRGRGIEKGHSFHVGLNGKAPAADQAVGLLKHRYSWENTRTVGATPLHVPEAGLHTLSLWMREDGCIVDKIVITSSSEFRLWSGL
jgi:DUF1680 family protein